MPADPPADLRIAVVVYDNAVDELERLTRSLVATVGEARAAGGVATVTLAFGDCSPEPVLVEAVAERLEALLEGAEMALSVAVFGENLGSAGGNNRLLTEAPEEVALVINPDTYPAPTMLRVMVETLRRHERVAVVEARQLPVEQPKVFDPVTGDTSWSSGCCYLARRGVVFSDLGGYDADNFPLYCDDVDLSWRVRLAGYRVVHAPRAVIFHDKRIRPDAGVVFNDAEIYWGVLSALLLAHKYEHPDLAESIAGFIERGGADRQRDALAEFRRRQADGRLPAPLPGGASVAQFVGSDYAEHRFSYP